MRMNQREIKKVGEKSRFESCRLGLDV